MSEIINSCPLPRRALTVSDRAPLPGDGLSFDHHRGDTKLLEITGYDETYSPRLVSAEIDTLRILLFDEDMIRAECQYFSRADDGPVTVEIAPVDIPDKAR